MSDDIVQNALIMLDTNTDIKIVKGGKPIPVERKKSAEEVHAPQVKEGFSRLFPSFYIINHQNVVDTKTKKKTTEKETFTRYLQPAGSDKTAIFTTKEIYFIPLEFKFPRSYYKKAFNPNEKSAPDCQSGNGIVPSTPKFARSCDECEFSKWNGSTPPPCREQVEILALDMTSKTIQDPEVQQAVTREAVTIAFPSTSIKGIREVMKKLAEPVLFDDGTYGPIDMTQYVVKATLSTATDADGKELTYCMATLEVIGQVPFEVSEQLIAMINTPSAAHGGKTPLELFIGKKDAFDAVVKEEESAPAPSSAEKVEKAAPPKSTPVTAKPAAEQTVEVKAEPVAPSPAPTVVVEDEEEEVPVNPPAPAPAPAVAPPKVTPASAPAASEDDDEIVF